MTLAEPGISVRVPGPDEATRFLLQDRAWSAYPLGYLDPRAGITTQTWGAGIPGGPLEALLVMAHLTYLVNVFAAGSASAVAAIMRQLPEIPPSGVFSARTEVLDAMEPHLQVTTAYRMRRLVVTPTELRPRRDREVQRLGIEHLDHVRKLYGLWTDNHQLPAQLSGGIYYGCFQGRDLVAAAGTHALALEHGVGAVGNVLTHASHRGRGLASTTTTAVTEELFTRGCDQVVLNVRIGNDIALDTYRKLGFREHCTFIEGVFRRR